MRKSGHQAAGSVHRLLPANDEARRLLGLGPLPEGERIAGLGMDTRVVELLTTRRVVSDAVCEAAYRYLPAQADGAGVGGDWFDWTEQSLADGSPPPNALTDEALPGQWDDLAQ
nr:hypothetical protein OH820_19460 [Streptomyces sp. NBC_00857]